MSYYCIMMIDLSTALSKGAGVDFLNFRPTFRGLGSLPQFPPGQPWSVVVFVMVAKKVTAEKSQEMVAL